MTQAIEVIDGSKKWGSRVSKCPLYEKINKILLAQVVYGDTDSVFVSENFLVLALSV